MFGFRASSAYYGWYKNVAQKDLMAKLGCSNIHDIPRFTKLTLQIDLKATSGDLKSVIACLFMLEVISGQKAVYRKPRTYRKTSSCFVTLRGQRMWDFLAIFSQIVLPRLSQNTITKGAQSNINSLHVLKLRDEGGNLIFYMKDLFLFPQFEATGQLEGIEDYLPRIFGMSLSFSSTSKTKVEKRLLLESLQIPLDCS